MINRREIAGSGRKVFGGWLSWVIMIGTQMFSTVRRISQL
jgi:hypothetical protein